ncbi:ExbD/TolR family protein [Sansalvadorimonas verongulae]|uniref:ExbD/TolR family protein n=1 Tax=Sansalvadorimonas verongulae TaxID=2172824 RepID=UPI0012BCD120|nr:biopolymer transporter ExbD [Sansalvadorimonas verongulae]MTI14680.1 biopolymer transporter ExbD [Sansalvadorimonas verongulae]
MRFRRQPVQEVSVNLTPLIDVVFLLLIFFMVSTTFTKESRLEVDLPEAAEVTTAVKERREISIEISQTGVYAISGQVLPGNSLEVVKAALERAASGDTTRPVVLTADAKTPHESVVVAMEAAGELGFSKLSIATQQPVKNTR